MKSEAANTKRFEDGIYSSSLILARKVGAYPNEAP